MAHGNPLLELRDLGQSVWYDYIRNDLLETGELARLIERDGLAGLTSNPSIFDKAITGSDLYDPFIREALAASGDSSAEDLFYHLAIGDLRAAADAFLPVYEASGRADGYVSLEVSPDLAHDTDGTVREAQSLFERVGRPNLMIKVPATREGLPAIERLIAAGVNVNITLLFAVERYQQVLEAYLRGLETRLDRGLPLSGIASVASFFVSRVDSALDPLIEERVRDGEPVEHMLGSLAVANARLAYAHYRELREGERHARLSAAGAQPQRLLWASTGAKNPRYSDVLYVESLIGKETVNTLPPDTYAAFRDHGRARPTLDEGVAEAGALMQRLTDLGIDLEGVTDRLEAEGVKAFADAFKHLLAGIEDKRARLAA